MSKMREVLEPPIFEKGSPGRSGVDVCAAEVPQVGLPDGFCAPTWKAFPRSTSPRFCVTTTRLSQTNYTAATPFLSAGLVHDEVQPGCQRKGGRASGLQFDPSLRAGLHRAGRVGAD